MWPFSPLQRAALAGGHDPLSRVDVWHAGQPVHTLEVIGGSVNTQTNRAVRRSMTCTLTDPTGTLTTGDAKDLLNPQCEIAPWRGVRAYEAKVGDALVPNGGFGVQPFGTSGFGGVDLVATTVHIPRDELAPQGVFALTSRDVVDTPEGLVITLTGMDRAMHFQGPMDTALAIPGGTPIEDAIIRLLAKRRPGLTVLAMRTGFTCGPLVYPPDIDVWAEAQKLAVSVGAHLFHDRTGQAILAQAGAVSDSPVAAWSYGDGLLLRANRKEDWDTIRNVVVAENPAGTIRAVAEDTDPASPTYARGLYRKVAPPLINPHFGSVDQAMQAATARLGYELGRAETVTFTAVPHPGIDVDEVVTVHDERVDLDHRGVIVSSIDLPLAVTEEMRVACRQSRLAANGEVLPLQETGA